MAIIGLNPFGGGKKGKTGKKKASGKAAYAKMKAVKKKAKTCEFC